MKMLITSFFLVFFAFSTYAQASEMAIAKVEYTFTHIRDTTEPDKPYQENMVLIIGKNASRYLSMDAINQKAKREKEMRKQIEENQGSNMNLKMGSMKPVTRNEYFYFTKENKLVLQDRLINTYLIEEPNYVIDWNITNDTMSFEGIHCQKATAYFKGRNWIAWYATELPFQSGPWKLNGLPGLIIDAHDVKNEVKFEFAGMRKINDEQNKNNAQKEEDQLTSKLSEQLKGLQEVPFQDKEIKFPENAIKTNSAEFKKLKETMDKDPEGFINAQFAGTGSTIKITRTTDSKSSDKTVKNTFNNPLELSDK